MVFDGGRSREHMLIFKYLPLKELVIFLAGSGEKQEMIFRL